MLSQYLHYGLLIALAIALAFAAFTDIRERKISNRLNLAIVLGAPLFWWASGLSLLPEGPTVFAPTSVAFQFVIALIVFFACAGLNALKMMGGGDVKLLTALALWIEPSVFLQLLIIMALAGGVLTIVMGAYHFLRRQKERLAIPYGVAIAFGGLWVLTTTYFPEAANAAVLG
ncbi:MAG: prepilin peptidase [Pseudomonadota bacterium]